MTSENEESSAVKANTEKPKPRTKAGVAPQGAHVAAKRAEAAKKATPKKISAKRAKVTETARDGSKAAKVLDLLKRPDGATLKDLVKATDWQSHSVRGFLSGTIGKKMGLKITSAKTDEGERSYSVKG